MIKAGDWLDIPEPHYQYGTGMLSLQVTWIKESGDPEWVQVTGTSQYWEGERYALVRRSALKNALRK